MKVYNIAEAKANLSRIVEMVHRGEEVTIAKNNRPLVDLVAHKPRRQRSFGFAKGQISIPEDFNDPSDDIEELFYDKRTGDRDDPA